MSEQEVSMKLSIVEQQRDRAAILVEVDPENSSMQITGLGMVEDLDGVAYLRDVLATALDGLEAILDNQGYTVTTEAHEHKPVQHRDGKEPWCDACQLTAAFKEPKTKFGPK